MDTKTAVAQRILSLCKERRITVNKLCTVAGVTQSTISDIVNGTTSNPGIVTIKKLCDGLNLTLGEFFSTEEFDRLEQEIK